MEHVYFHSGKKHEIKDSNLPENLETRVAGKDVESIWAYNHARKNKSHDLRNPDSLEHQGANQDYEQNQQEYHNRLGERQVQYGKRKIHILNISRALQSVACSTSSGLMPKTSATLSLTQQRNELSLRLPLLGTGARYGESVSSKTC